MLALPGLDGQIDRDNVLIGCEEKFIAWCRKVFEHYFKMSEVY
jgi:predicted transcriptional regulator